MSLTAVDDETGAVIFPFDEGRSRALCRDDSCRAVMEAVHEVTDEVDGVKVVVRRAYWRHRATSDPTKRCKSIRSDKTEWHVGWQMRCSDPERVEFRVGPVGKCRIADVFTKFGWALEFQYSSIDKATVTRRENHYRGKVLWIIDANPVHSMNGSVDIYRDHLRWSGVKGWVIESETMVSVDDGFVIYMLPPGGLRRYMQANELMVPMAHVRTIEHGAFTDTWINGDTNPLGGQPNTEWHQIHTRKAEKSADKARADRALAAGSARKEKYDKASEVCAYGGDREKLVYQTPPHRAFRSVYRTKQPCENCGDEQARPYLIGWRCETHGPNAIKEQTA
jgi:hypothetical protein